MKETLIIYRDWWQAIKSLPEDLRFKAFDAICSYAFEGIEPEDAIIAAVTALMRSAIDRDRAKYEDICNKRRISGRLGGAPKGNRNASKTTQNNQNQPKQANGFINNQNQPKQPDNDNEYDNDNKSSKEDINKKISPNGDMKKENSANAESHRKSDESRVDYEKLKNFFNKTLEENHSSISRINTIDKTRRGMLHSRIQEHGKEAVVMVFQKAASSNFLNGDNQRGFIANFNWIIRPTNFLKVLEGNYDNKRISGNENKRQDRFEQRRGTETNAYGAEDYDEPL